MFSNRQFLAVLSTLFFVCHVFAFKTGECRLKKEFWWNPINSDKSKSNTQIIPTSINTATRLFGTTGKRYADVLEFLRSNQPKVRSPSPVEESEKDRELIETIVTAADDRKAIDIIVLNLKGISDTTDYVVVMEGNSKPQNQAILSTIVDNLRDKFALNGKVQGEAASGWVLIDYGSIIVNIMLPKMRQFYKIEKKWKDGKKVDISHLLNRKIESDDNDESNTQDQQTEEQRRNTQPNLDETQDPFWSN